MSTSKALRIYILMLYLSIQMHDHVVCLGHRQRLLKAVSALEILYLDPSFPSFVPIFGFAHKTSTINPGRQSRVVPPQPLRINSTHDCDDTEIREEEVSQGRDKNLFYVSLAPSGRHERNF